MSDRDKCLIGFEIMGGKELRIGRRNSFFEKFSFERELVME